MTKEKQYNTGGAVLLYTDEGARVAVTGCRGQAGRLKIPRKIEGFPVTAIAKKAFLGNKYLTEAALPDTLEEIGDWAFAHCSSLRKLVLQGGDVRIGKGVFKDCKALAEVRLAPAPEDRALSPEARVLSAEARTLSPDPRALSPEDQMPAQEDRAVQVARLLAAVPVMLDAEYLFLPREAGTAEWLEKWDSRLMVLLLKSDESGFTRLVLCGEEDLLANLPDYVAQRRRDKARMCFLRLLNPVGLSKEREEMLADYLRTHAKGCESEAAWEVVLREHGDERPYYELLADAGCVTAENLTDMLSDMKEEHAEMKAFLMRYREENLGESDFFDSLSLD